MLTKSTNDVIPKSKNKDLFMTRAPKSVETDAAAEQPSEPTAVAPQARTRMTQETVAEIERELQNGASTAFVADKYGKSVATIANIKRRITGGASSASKTSQPVRGLKSRLIEYAVMLLLNPSAVTEEQTKKLRDEVQKDMMQKYIHEV